LSRPVHAAVGGSTDSSKQSNRPGHRRTPDSDGAIARDMGIARTTVMRMAPEAARFSAYTDCFVNIPLPATRFETSETGRGVADNNTGVRGNGDGG
jgi:hypothetical protein